MKLKFEQGEGMEGMWTVREDGIDTGTKTYEHIGIINFVDVPALFLSEEYSGILEEDELKQITEFMEMKKCN